MLEC